MERLARRMRFLRMRWLVATKDRKLATPVEPEKPCLLLLLR